MNLNNSEFAAIIAGLRMLQGTIGARTKTAAQGAALAASVYEIMTDCGRCAPLKEDQIESLINKLQEAA